MLGNTPWHGLIELSAHLLADRTWGTRATRARIRNKIDHLTLHSLAIVEAMGQKDLIPSKWKKTKLTKRQVEGFLYNNNRAIGHIDFSPYTLTKKKGLLDIKFNADNDLKSGEELELTPSDVFAINRQISDIIRSIKFKMGLSEYHKLMRNKNNKVLKNLAERSPRWEERIKRIGTGYTLEVIHSLLTANDARVPWDLKIIDRALKRGHFTKHDILLNQYYEHRKNNLGHTPEEIAKRIDNPDTGENAEYVMGESHNRLAYLKSALMWWPAYHKDLPGSVSDVLLGVDALDQSGFKNMRDTLYHLSFFGTVYPAHKLVVKDVMQYDPGEGYRGEIKVRLNKNKEGGVDVRIKSNDLGEKSHDMGWMLGSGKSHIVVDAMGVKKEVKRTEKGTVVTLHNIGRVRKRRKK